ncbi:MAG: hypothetical protein AMS23_09615 [Bacteroides sp. SM1_62]|nr:MAG: hypothetical protein AMS26_01675 [Bacteroides sp. SM23_62]KPL21234.1 MAG: hypothetical protein AMS23_09615 [Bacteroides sp. SM1_62]
MIHTGCEDNDPLDNNQRRVVGTGPIVSKTLTLDEFSKIENTGVANIYVTLGNPQSVVLKAQQNIIDVMTIGVLNDVLQIGVEKNVSIENAEEIRFDITIPEISSVTLTGVGDYILSGDYQEELTIILTGVGNVRAFDLEVGTCTITSTGIGNCEVHVKNTLVVTITGVGSVYYRGHPGITQSVTGLGSLVDAN